MRSNTKKAYQIFILCLCCVFSISKHVQSQGKPNILWLSCEDISPTLSMYGDSTAYTPNLDRLASESIIYTEAYATVGVCAPSRSSIITGMYPISIGTHNMRTAGDVQGWGRRIYNKKPRAKDINNEPVPFYSTVVPSGVRPFTEILRKHGYYCANNLKTDYQFACPVTAWDANSQEAHWRNRKHGQPFFAVFNHVVTHESFLWRNKPLQLTVNPKNIPLPPYFPDTKTVRNDVDRNYSNIELLDAQIGRKLKDLEDEGLLDSTIIFFFSDHGGPLPRGKRLHYESGLRVPLMVRIPTKLKKEFNSNIVQLLDLGPTVLSLAGIQVPKYMQGKPFLGNAKDKRGRQYAFGSADRFDECTDRNRTVIDKDYVYVRNYYPKLPAYKDIAYRLGIDMMRELLQLRDEGALNKDQMYWFREHKTKEEFYNRHTDPFSLHNQIDDPKYKNDIVRMRKAMDQWQKQVGDKGSIPEKQLFLNMWPGGIQPQTQEPIVKKKNGKLTISCPTESASIAYIISEKDFEPDLDAGWQIYYKPLTLKQGEHLYLVANRIGYKDSEMVKLEQTN